MDLPEGFNDLPSIGPQCGTINGWRKHNREGTKPCSECAAAKREDTRQRRIKDSKQLHLLKHPSDRAWEAGCRCTPCSELHKYKNSAAYKRLRRNRKNA